MTAPPVAYAPLTMCSAMTKCYLLFTSLLVLQVTIVSHFLFLGFFFTDCNIEHFTRLSIFSIPSFVNYLFMSFAHFFFFSENIDLFPFLLQLFFQFSFTFVIFWSIEILSFHIFKSVIFSFTISSNYFYTKKVFLILRPD